jgi:protein regulator of cytokinesis 1
MLYLAKCLPRSEKQDMIAEAEHLINTIKQMEVALDDEKANGQYELDNDVQVTFPLNRCIVALKEKYSAISRLHRERYEQVKSMSHSTVFRLRNK